MSFYTLRFIYKTVASNARKIRNSTIRFTFFLLKQTNKQDEPETWSYFWPKLDIQMSSFFNSLNKKTLLVSIISLCVFIVIPFKVDIFGPSKNALIKISISQDNLISRIFIYTNCIVQLVILCYYTFSRKNFKLNTVLIWLWLLVNILFGLFLAVIVSIYINDSFLSRWSN